jgi:hypothetical protein
MIKGLFNTPKTAKEHKPVQYTILNNRFSFKLNSEWQDNTVHTYEGPLEDGIKHNILVTIESQVDLSDLERYADMQIKAIETELQGYHELKRGPVILSNQLPGYELVYKWYPVEDREVYQRSIYILHNETGYILTATFSKKTWKTRGPEVDKILMSFAIQ